MDYFRNQRHGWILYLIRFSSICGLLNSNKNWERYEWSKFGLFFWKFLKIMVIGGWRWLSKMTPTLGCERVWSTPWPFDLTVGQFWFIGYYWTLLTCFYIFVINDSFKINLFCIYLLINGWVRECETCKN